MNLTKIESDPKVIVIPQFMDEDNWYTVPIVIDTKDEFVKKIYKLNVKSYYQADEDRVYTRCDLNDNGFWDNIEWMGLLGFVNNDKPRICFANHNITLSLDDSRRLIIEVPENYDVYVGEFTILLE